MIQISIEQMKQIHKELICETGGSEGLRDIGLLESAMYAPFQSFDGEALYPSIQRKAAKLGFGLIQNHPFIDGNKRLGIHAMLIFLAINGVFLTYSQSELVQVGLALASGKIGEQELMNWIAEHEV